MSESYIEVTCNFYPSPWDDDVVAQVFEILVGSEGFIHPTHEVVRESRSAIAGDPLEFAISRYSRSSQSNAFTLDEGNSIARLRFHRSEWSETSTRGHLSHWPKSLIMRRHSQKGFDSSDERRMARLMELTSCPLLAIDYGTYDGPTTLSLVARRKMDRAVSKSVSEDAAGGPWCGIADIPWRVMIGPPFVESIGLPVLESLEGPWVWAAAPSIWVLQTAPEASASIEPSGRDRAEWLKENLGVGHFLDLDKLVPPDIKPRIPQRWVPKSSA